MNHKLRVLFYVLLTVMMGLIATGEQASLADGSIIYVDADATGANNGTSWVDAYTDLQPAQDAAVSGDQIWVAEGTYFPTYLFDPLDPRSACFQMKNGVAIYGGFAGSETDLEQRDWVSNTTILSGDLGTVGDVSDNSYHIFLHPEELALDSSAILDGFTITGGNYNTFTYHFGGGGMYNDHSSPTLINVTFSGNTASDGGGMLNYLSSPTLTGVTFSTNSADCGGGMFNYQSNPTLMEVTFSTNSGYSRGGGMFNTQSDPTLTEVTFLGNATNYYGGGMYNDSSSPTLTEVTFSTNSAGYGGGMYNSYGSNPTLSNVTFSTNMALNHGGGMYNYHISKPTLTNVTFSTNVSLTGGGMYNDYSSPSLTNVKFSANTAASEGGGMYNNNYSYTTLINVTFVGNAVTDTESNGGAMYNNFSYPTMINVTFSANSANSGGGGMYTFGGSPTLTNAILWGNTPDQISGETVLVTYSDIQGGYPGTGNIDLDPRFLRLPSPGGDGTWGTPDDDYGDLRLQPTSPAIDAGNNTAVPSGITFDLYGAARFVDIPNIPDTGLGIPPLVDMGAYEVQLTVFLPLMLLLK